MTANQYKELSIKEFTKAAEVYESDHAGVYNMCKKDYPDVLAELEKEPFTDLLDCGCGTAPMISLLYEKYPEKHYTGIDLTPKMIEAAKAKKLKGVDEGVVARTILFDNEMRKALQKYPNAVVVNIGCGFDDRFSRVDNGKVLWYNVDLPDSIALRRKCFAEKEREFMIEGDLLSDTWTDGIPNDRVAIIIAEGLLMYFTEEQVKHLFDHIRDHFGRGYILAELMHPMAANNSKHHDTVKNTNAQFRWGIADGKEVEALCEGYRFLRETSFFEEMKKYTAAGKIGDLFFRKFNDRLAVYRFCK